MRASSVIPFGRGSYSRFCAELNSARSSLIPKSTSINCAPANNCIIMPDVTTGVIPSSMRVPLLDAKMARIQYRGSDESEDMMPYRGTWEQTRKMRRVVAVHRTLWLKGTCARGEDMSWCGRKGVPFCRALPLRAGCSGRAAPALGI